jgi:IS30 family transposase
MAGIALDAHEREEIRVGIGAEESLSDIARRLDRVPSTITREVIRNGGRSNYCAATAQERCAKQLLRPRLTTLQANKPLAAHVEQRLRAKDSPTTIAIELARAGGIGGDTVSPETIYQGVYAHGTRGLAKGLGKHLHRKRGRRKPRCRGERKKSSALGKFNLIHTRPKRAEHRRQIGHFEGDLIIGARSRSAIVTLVDRASRFNLMGDLPGGHSAENVLACCIELLERVPEELRRSLTWDSQNARADHCGQFEFSSASCVTMIGDQLSKEPRWLVTRTWKQPSASKCSSPIPTVPGNGARTRTSTPCLVATWAKEPISRSTIKTTSTRSVTASIQCRGESSNGRQLLIATMLLSLL